MSDYYAEDLAHVHHTGFGELARSGAHHLIRLLKRAGIPEGLVVDLGCGSGISARELQRAGYDVLGIDGSAAMLRLARAIAPGARFVQASLHEAELPPCAAVTALGETITYFPAGGDPPEFPVLFARVRAALAPGGLFLSDVVLRSEADPMRYHVVREGEDWRLEVDVEEEPDRSRLRRRIRVIRRIDGTERASEETHQVRTCSRTELEAWLRECGFTVRTCRRYGSMPLPPQRIGFVAKPSPDPE